MHTVLNTGLFTNRRQSRRSQPVQCFTAYPGRTSVVISSKAILHSPAGPDRYTCHRGGASAREWCAHHHFDASPLGACGLSVFLAVPGPCFFVTAGFQHGVLGVLECLDYEKHCVSAFTAAVTVSL